MIFGIKFWIRCCHDILREKNCNVNYVSNLNWGHSKKYWHMSIDFSNLKSKYLVDIWFIWMVDGQNCQ